MPAIFDHFVHHYDLTPHVAWRVTFVIPFIIITGTAIAMLLTCPDTPVGKWADRHAAVHQNLENSHRNGTVVMVPTQSDDGISNHSDKELGKDEKKADNTGMDVETTAGTVVDANDAAYSNEIVQKPTWQELIKVTFGSPQSIALGACYVCTFGAELAVNSILG